MPTLAATLESVLAGIDEMLRRAVESPDSEIYYNTSEIEVLVQVEEPSTESSDVVESVIEAVETGTLSAKAGGRANGARAWVPPVLSRRLTRGLGDAGLARVLAVYKQLQEEDERDEAPALVAPEDGETVESVVVGLFPIVIGSLARDLAYAQTECERVRASRAEESRRVVEEAAEWACKRRDEIDASVEEIVASRLVEHDSLADENYRLEHELILAHGREVALQGVIAKYMNK